MFLKRITIILDEDSEKGFGLVSNWLRYHLLLHEILNSPFQSGKHEFIDFFQLRYYRIDTDYSWHLVNCMPDTQPALCINRTRDITSPDFPAFTVSLEAYVDTDSHKKWCSFRDELLRCIR